MDNTRLIVDANRLLTGFPGITVAAAQGRALGFGCGVVVQSDIALAAASAELGFDEVHHGTAPAFVMSYLEDHVGPKRALDLIVTGRTLSAAEAEQWGIVTRVVAPELSGGERRGARGRAPAQPRRAARPAARPICGRTGRCRPRTGSTTPSRRSARRLRAAAQASPPVPAAVRFHRTGGPDVLVVDDVSPPEPGPGQLRLAVVAAGVNPVECRIRRGEVPVAGPGPGGSGRTWRGWWMRWPPAAGGAAVGPGPLARSVRYVAVSVGPDGSPRGWCGASRSRSGTPGEFGWALGGAYAEYALADAADLLPKPAALPWDVAASVAISGRRRTARWGCSA